VEPLLNTFAAPPLLLGLLLALLLALPLLLPKAAGRSWRLLALSAALLALAQPELPATASELVVVVDVSASVAETARESALRLSSDLDIAPRWVLFAGDAMRSDSLEASLPSALELGRSNLERALSVAAADGAQRILLISDGVDTQSTGTPSERAAQIVRNLPSAVSIDTLAVPRPANARFEALWAPERVAPGSPVEVLALIRLDQPAQLTLRPQVAGVSLPHQTLTLPAGQQTVAFTVPAEFTGSGGLLDISATLEVDFPQPTADDAQRLEVRVDRAAPVMVIGDPTAASLLRTQGFEVVEGGPELIAAPFDPSAVVLRSNVQAFSSGQLERLARYVDQGGGLLMTGGPDSFGLGGWYRTPVEGVLPVSSDVRTEVTAPQVAMVMVLDISQSMTAGNPSRLEIAKQGIVDVIDLAYQDDLLGLVIFSDPALTRWVFELRPATDAGKRIMADATLAVRAQGGTILLPGYTLALKALRESNASIRHVIVLSDGMLFDGTGPLASGGVPDWEALATAARREGITTSTVAIGADADGVALRALAGGGGGRFIEAFDVRTLPQLFTAEALTATRALLREEPFTPIASRHPLMPFEGALPVADAYIATSLSRGAEQLIAASDGEPLLAVGRAGLGRSAALTTDLSGWIGSLAGWGELPGVLAGVVRWLQSRPAPYSTSLTPLGSQLEVVVDAVIDGSYLNDRTLVARMGSEATPLEQIGPGRYRGLLPIVGSGGTVVVSEGAEVVARRSVATPDPEFAPIDGAELLQAISERTGGVVLNLGSPYRPLGSEQRTPLWPFFASAALLFSLIEFARRRFRRSESSPATPRSRGHRAGHQRQP